MALYFLLGTLTGDGQKLLRDNPNLLADVVANCDHEGADILAQYAVLGRYDVVVVVEAADNEAVARLSLEIGVPAGLHIETLPATSIGVPRGDSESQQKCDVEFAGGAPEPRDQWEVPHRDS